MGTIDKILFVVSILFALFLWWAVEMLNATEIDWESLQKLKPINGFYEGSVKEKKVSFLIKSKPIKYEVCEGDRWKNLAGVNVEVKKIMGHRFRWMVIDTKEKGTIRFFCQDKRLDLCGKRLRKGKGKCITWTCK